MDNITNILRKDKRYSKNGAQKFNFSYEKLDLTLIYDNYDDDIINIFLLIFDSESGKRDAFRCFIHDNLIKFSYNNDTPKDIKDKIVNDGNLKDIYEHITEHVKIDNPIDISYTLDRDFNTIKNYVNNIFVENYVSVKMPKKRFKELRKYGFKSEQLQKIQHNNKTLRFTKDCNKRLTMKEILNKIDNLGR